jgi:hypothetical protein
MAPDRGLLEILTRHSVPFVVIGGHAVNYHGHLRATEDIDLLWLRTTESEARLVAALGELKAEWIGDELDPATGIERTHPVTAAFVRSKPLMMLCTSSGYLDLFDHVPGIPDASVDALIGSACELDGVRYVSLAWLRRLKAASGRPRDLADLENLPMAE